MLLNFSFGAPHWMTGTSMLSVVVERACAPGSTMTGTGSFGGAVDVNDDEGSA